MEIPWQSVSRRVFAYQQVIQMRVFVFRLTFQLVSRSPGPLRAKDVTLTECRGMRANCRDKIHKYTWEWCTSCRPDATQLSPEIARSIVHNQVLPVGQHNLELLGAGEWLRDSYGFWWQSINPGRPTWECRQAKKIKLGNKAWRIYRTSSEFTERALKPSDTNDQLY